MSTKTLTHADRERIFYIMGMAGGFATVHPEKMVPMLLAIEKIYGVGYEKITREHEERIWPWFDDFLAVLHNLDKDEIIEYAKAISKMTTEQAGGMMFG